MKREACQHGMVWTYSVQPSPWNPKSEILHIPRFDSVPVAGSFSNVTSKASNHSKFTRKCGRSQCVECHLNPINKSKDKTKGTQKFRTNNIVDFNFSGFFATEILDYLYSFNEDEIDDHVNDHDDFYENGGTCVLDNNDDDDDDFMAKFWSLHDKQNDDDDDDDDDDDVSFCDVGFMLEIEEDDGWCLLGEM